jgi:hypothetical protein
MRIQDTELLQAMWDNQLRLLSKSVLHTYFGGKYGLVADDDFWFKSASSEHRCSRRNITDKIGSQQLMKRIKDLEEKGFVVDTHRDFLTFYVDGKNTRKAFEEARNWWKQQGVPEGFENNACRTVEMEKERVQSLAIECNNHLKELFPSYS